MTDLSDPMKRAHWELSALLMQAETVFKSGENMKLTLIARHPTNKDRWLVLTADEIPAVIELLQNYESRKPVP